MKGKEIRLVLKNQISDLEKIDPFVVELAEEFKISHGDRINLNLVMDEVLTNIIRHGFDDEADHLITIKACKDGHMLRLTIEDDGKAFDASSYPDPDTHQSLEERKIGGLGIYLVKQLMDKVEYAYKDSRNILVISKKLKP